MFFFFFLQDWMCASVGEDNILQVWQIVSRTLSVHCSRTVWHPVYFIAFVLELVVLQASNIINEEEEAQVDDKDIE